MKFQVSTVAATLALLSSSADAQPKGPNPTAANLQRDGPFSLQTISVSNGNTPGFGACDIYAPTATNVGTYGAVAVLPGFTNTRSAMAIWSRRVATHGFMVLNCDTNGRFDFPASRGTQLLAMVNWLRTSSPITNRIDTSRIAVAGYSMGGGGALDAIEQNRAIAAAVPLSPYNSEKDFSPATTPTLIIGGENDGTAPVNSHSIPFYNSLSGQKAYLELNNAPHGAPTSSNPTISLYSVAWLKAFVDDDSRYTSYVCPGPSNGGTIEEYRSSCSGPRGAAQVKSLDGTDNNTLMIGAVIGGVVFVAALVGAAFSVKRRSDAKAVEEKKAVASPDMMI